MSEDYCRENRIRNGRRKLQVFLRLSFLLLIMIFALGNDACPPTGSPSLPCQNVNLIIEPGSCQVILNPCRADGEWADRPDVDFFKLQPRIGQNRVSDNEVRVHTERANGEVVRSICVGAHAQRFPNENIPYMYSLGPQWGTAAVVLTVASPLGLTVTASPSQISAGQSTQLIASVTGGIAPYFYSWTPANDLDDSDIAAPIASPLVTTEYRVRVVDTAGHEVIGSVTVQVGFEVEATATPSTVVLNGSTSLMAITRGGSEPFTFSWTPAATVSNPQAQLTTATPLQTTLYTVTARDATGAQRTSSVQVVVVPELVVQATATPASIQAGQTSQLEANVSGGTPPYSYSWSPAISLSNSLIQNPVASPTVGTLYRVTVTDSMGLTASALVPVHIINPVPLSASFTFTTVCCPTIQVDASASTGDIVSYSWDLSWTTLSPDLTTAQPLASFAGEAGQGTITLTVTDRNGNTATAVRNFP